METWEVFLERRKKVDERICVIMRGISGSGKSTRVREILSQLGGTPEGHVFSTDDFFIPVTLKLRKHVHEIDGLSDEAAANLCQDVMQMWYSIPWNDTKKDAQLAILDFKKVVDEGKSKEALHIAAGMTKTLELVEYKGKWHGSKLKAAHAHNLARFKEAVDRGVTPVICDNTNVDARACRAYVEYAQKADYKIRIEEPNSEHWKAHRDLFKDKYSNKEKLSAFAKILADKNTHGVPLEGIERQIANWKHNLTVDDIMAAK